MAEQTIKPMDSGGTTTPSNGKPDPTGNVLLLVEAAVKRLDDLREAETRRVNEQSKLRDDYGFRLSEAESKRIDAIRSVDVNNVAIESERQAAQANVLATQVAASAEALRALVAATAATIAQQLTQLTSQLTERLAALEKAQYEGSGKQQLADPVMATLVSEMKAMRESGSERKGVGAGMKDLMGWIVAGILFVIAIIGFADKFGR